jgi:hypothetical protein
MKRFVTLGLALAVIATTGCTSTMAQQTAPPASNYKKVSTLVALPDFVPGFGTLYVDPKTVPAGPFLAYDRQGKLVSSVYRFPSTTSPGGRKPRAGRRYPRRRGRPSRASRPS